MAADTQGNDLSLVGLPITGKVAVQLSGAPSFIDSAAGAAVPLTLPEGYTYLGLVTQDGAPQSDGEAGDAIEFWQAGYKMQGDATLTLTVTLAEMNETVRKLVTGKTADANGMITIDALVPDATFPLFVATEMKNGVQHRRNGLARVQSVTPSQETRGEVAAHEVTFEWVRSEEIGGFYRDWFVNPAAKKTSGK